MRRLLIISTLVVGALPGGNKALATLDIAKPAGVAIIRGPAARASGLIEAAEVVLAARGGAAESTARADLRISRELLDVVERQWADPLTQAVALAKSGSGASAHAPSRPSMTPSWRTAHASPAKAAQALALRHGASADRDSLARLEAIEGRARSALTHVMDAFASFEAATREAFATLDHSVLTAMGERDEVAPRAPRLAQTSAALTENDLSWHRAIDLSAVLAARNDLLDAVLALSDILGSSGTSAGACSPIAVPPAFSIDLDDCDNTYAQDIALLIDAGGNDTYLNNAGGGNLSSGYCELVLPQAPAAMLVDLAGDDAYGDPQNPRSCGANGGGYVGAGFLLDAAGNDTYTARIAGTNGGGDSCGVGFLLDTGGSDNYTATGFGTNGGGDVCGSGFLLDSGGDDVYVGGGNGSNGGGNFGGGGFLLDAGGNDLYRGGAGGGNGGVLNGGTGFLLDASGTDRYEGTSNGSNGGAAQGGVGFLLDAAGDDVYAAWFYGANGGGAFGGTGIILDASGADVYEARGLGPNSLGFGANGGGYLAGAGLLIDVNGNDAYTAGRVGVNGGSYLGAGLLLDAGGTDAYKDDDAGSGTDCSVAPKGVVGAQLDLPNGVC